MSSLLTNTSAMSALQNLASTQKSLATIQSQISTGLKVATASDNAAYWSISTTLKSDTGALSAVSDALNLGNSVVSTATSAITSILTILNKIKQDVVTAQQPGTDKTQVQSDITAQQQSLSSIIKSASFNGINVLSGDTVASTSYGSAAGQIDFVASYVRSSTGGVVSTITLDSTKTNLMGSGAGKLGVLNGATSGDGTTASTNISSFSVASASNTDLTTYAKDVDAAIKSVTGVGATVGSTTTALANQSTFVTALSNAITSGVGSLVDADMNVASTRLQALQTQQQLGIQSLSIANQNSQLILKLFQG